MVIIIGICLLEKPNTLVVIRSVITKEEATEVVEAREVIITTKTIVSQAIRMVIIKIIEEKNLIREVAIIIEEEAAENIITKDIMIIKRLRSMRPLDQELTVTTSQL